MINKHRLDFTFIWWIGFPSKNKIKNMTACIFRKEPTLIDWIMFRDHFGKLFLGIYNTISFKLSHKIFFFLFWYTQYFPTNSTFNFMF